MPDNPAKKEKNSLPNKSEKETVPAQTEENGEIKLSAAEYEKMLGALKEAEALKENLLRSAADFENAKKRLSKEKEDFVKYCQENLMRELLPALDNFERAMSHGNTDDPKQLKGIVTGIQMVFKQMSEVLKKYGLKRIDAVGKMFDPHFHEAIVHAEEQGKEDEIVGEIEPGYVLHDRLLRASKVKIRIAPKASSQKNSSEEKPEELT